MGPCSSTSKHHNNPSELKEVIPDLTYISRSRKLLIICHNGQSECVELEGQLEIYPDSLIAFIKSTYIIVLGGTKASGELSCKAYAINSVHITIHNLPDFPQGINQGNIFFDDSQILAIDSSCFKVFSYQLEAPAWNTLELTFEHSKYKRFKDFGSFLQGNQVFLINPSYRNEIKESIYFFSLEERKVTKSDQVCSFKLIRPLCLVTQDSVVVGGGLNEEKKPNIRLFCKKKNEDWQEMKGPRVSYYESHPFLLVENNPIFFSDTQVIVKFAKKFSVFNLRLPENLKISNFLSNKETNGSEINLAQSSLSERSFPDEFKESVETRPQEVKPIQIPQDVTSEENKSLVNERSFKQGSRSPIRGIEIEVKRLNKPAPFLPSNVRKDTHLESESSFTEWDDE